LSAALGTEAADLAEIKEDVDSLPVVVARNKAAPNTVPVTYTKPWSLEITAEQWTTCKVVSYMIHAVTL